MKEFFEAKNEDEMLETFRKNLYTLRKQNILTQEELANRIGVKRTTISSYENGVSYPDLNTLLKISSVFEKSPNELLGLELNDVNEKGDKKKQFSIDTGLSIGAIYTLYKLKTDGNHAEEIEALDYLIRYNNHTDDGSSILKCLYDTLHHPELTIKNTMNPDLIHIYRNTRNQNNEYFLINSMDSGEPVSMGEVYLLLLNKKINTVVKKIWKKSRLQDELISKLKSIKNKSKDI